MNRDGQLTSLWQDTAGYTPTSVWDSNTQYDVLIIGGGITGLTTALLLQEGGKKCVLAEAKNIGFGTTGGTTAHLNTLLDTPYSTIRKNFSADDAKLVAGGAKEAIHLVEQLTRKYDIDSDFLYKSAQVYAENEKEAKTLDDIYDSAKEAGVICEPLNDVQIPARYIKAYKFDGQGQIHPLKYITGLARAYEQLGGIILEDCFVSNVTNENDTITATTTRGDIKANTSVYATHLPPGINIFSFRCAPYRSYAIAFTLKSGDYPTTLIYDSQDPYHYFRTHEVNGQKYVIAGGYDHKTGHHNNTEYIFTQLEAYVHEYFDIDKVVYKWSSQYYESVDGLPYIGLMPGSSNMYVATGYGGNGITLGSLAGKILCDLIVSGNSAYQEVFKPGRIKMLAGMSNFIRENADVISMFIGKRLDYEHINELAALANEEAKVIEYNGEHIALYKDEKGRIHPLDPVCPHAKCIVVWNSAEKSWDCPCHGGRYAPDGTLLTGPARKGLTPIDWSHL